MAVAEAEEIPAPTKRVLYMRSYNPRIDQCKSPICVEKRKHTTCKRALTYVYFYRCISCKTNWEKERTHCGCCGDTLRKSARKKTPYKKTVPE